LDLLISYGTCVMECSIESTFISTIKWLYSDFIHTHQWNSIRQPKKKNRDNFFQLNYDEILACLLTKASLLSEASKWRVNKWKKSESLAFLNLCQFWHKCNGSERQQSETRDLIVSFYRKLHNNVRLRWFASRKWESERQRSSAMGEDTKNELFALNCVFISP
jgi:hypothetical protein